jgi:GT2 family glycosyltransferase
MKSLINNVLDNKIIRSNGELFSNTWVVILNVYDPPDEFYVSLSKLLNNPLDIYIIDSSREGGIYNSNALFRQYLQSKQNGRIKYINIENKGAPYALNLGLEEVLRAKYQFITILTDDTIFINDFLPLQSIEGFFYKNCNPYKDILLLTDLKTAGKKYIRRSTEAGMTFHREALKNVKFREDLVMDQFDVYFCDDIYRHGGKIVVYPEAIFKTLPVGRESNKGHNMLPSWRLYLLTRNTVALFLLKQNKLFQDVFKNFIFYVKPIIYGKNKLAYIRVFITGLIDGFRLNLGITKNLQRLSNNRFAQPEINENNKGEN